MPGVEWLDAAVGGVLGLLIGSFLNVVIHRLPKMLYRGWLTDAAANLSSSQQSPSLWQLVFGHGADAPAALVMQAQQIQLVSVGQGLLGHAGRQGRNAQAL